jgi:prepilin-type N-terminal cleavage/methylation domain-containing protein
MIQVAPRSDGRGLTLVEALVALAVLGVGLAVALGQFETVRRALADGESSAQLQQTLRVGFDRLSTELRAAGLGVEPDGNTSRPDEAIEAAHERALVIRADFDARTPDASVPEQALAAGGPFANVTTGNDEIHAWVLAKPHGSCPHVIEFSADVEGVPRDGTVETVTIPRVALDHDDPPYTLYRVTVRPDSTRTVREPVIDNVHSLRFTYFDAGGNALHPPGGAEDDLARRTRSAIRRVRIELEGIGPRRGPGSTDLGDPATRSRRRYRLVGDVTPRALGLPGSPVPPT